MTLLKSTRLTRRAVRIFKKKNFLSDVIFKRIRDIQRSLPQKPVLMIFLAHYDDEIAHQALIRDWIKKGGEVHMCWITNSNGPRGHKSARARVKMSRKKKKTSIKVAKRAGVKRENMHFIELDEVHMYAGFCNRDIQETFSREGELPNLDKLIKANFMGVRDVGKVLHKTGQAIYSLMEVIGRIDCVAFGNDTDAIKGHGWTARLAGKAIVQLTEEGKMNPLVLVNPQQVLNGRGGKKRWYRFPNEDEDSEIHTIYNRKATGFEMWTKLRLVMSYGATTFEDLGLFLGVVFGGFRKSWHLLRNDYFREVTLEELKLFGTSQRYGGEASDAFDDSVHLDFAHTFTDNTITPMATIEMEGPFVAQRINSLEQLDSLTGHNLVAGQLVPIEDMLVELRTHGMIRRM